MTLPFNSLPAQLRLPGVFLEFDNSLAAQAEQSFRVLVIGQRLSTGSVAEGVPTRVTNESQAEAYFGRGSMLAEMLKRMKGVDRYTETWAIALDENGAGSAAAATISVTGTATEAGTLNLYLAGYRIQAAVSAGDTGAEVAAALAAAFADLHPASAAVNGTTDTQVDLTARWKGETGNDLDLRLNYYDESTPAGLTVTLGSFSGGASNPDVATAIAAMGDTWWNWVVMPYTDAANLTALEAELNTRWGPMVQKGARAFAAYRGAHAATGTFGGTRNSPHLTVMGTNLVPEPPYLWAAVNAIRAAGALALDPARPLQTLELSGLKAPSMGVAWTDDERNLLLYDGIATYRATADGRVVIERQITTYQTNAAGVDDISYLDINRPETLERVRYAQRTRVALRFPRHKLSATGGNFGAGQPIVTADLLKGELLGLYQELIELGWVDDYEGYAASIVVEVDTANGRISWKDEPRLMGQARTFAGLVQFRI